MDLDWQLYDLYQTLLNKLDKDRIAELKREESSWVTLRAGCRSDESCLTEAYNSRISQLLSLSTH